MVALSRNKGRKHWSSSLAKHLPKSPVWQQGDQIDDKDKISCPKGWEWTGNWQVDDNRAVDDEGEFNQERGHKLEICWEWNAFFNLKDITCGNCHVIWYISLAYGAYEVKSLLSFSLLSSLFYLLQFYLLSVLQAYEDEVLPFFDSGDWFINTLFPVIPFFSSCVETEVYCSCLISQMTTKVVKSLNTCVSTLQAGNMLSTYLTEFMVLSRGLIIWLDEDDGSERDFLRIPKWL